MVKIFHDQNSWRISSHINAHTSNILHDSFFQANFHVNMLLAKLPNTSPRGFLSMSWNIVDYYLVDLVNQRDLQ